MKHVIIWSLFYSMGFMTIVSCSGKEQPLKIEPKNPNSNAFETAIDSTEIEVFLLDGKQGLFEKRPWYYYHFNTHTIWSNFNIYALQTPDKKIFRMQILSYYDLNNSLLGGIYKIRLQLQSGEIKEFNLDATACGNIYTNPNYLDCEADPSKNTFTYLNLSTLKQKKMTDEAARKDTSWHIAFKRTEIKLNEAVQESEVLAGLLYKDDRVPEDLEDTSLLQEKITQNFGMKDFSNHPLPPVISMQSPGSVSRVIAKEKWLDEDSLTARSDKKWSIRADSSKDSKSYLFSVEKVTVLENLDSELLFRLSKNGKQENSHTFKVQFNNAEDSLNICFDFESQSSFECKRDKKNWVFKFKNRASEEKFKWSISTQHGARKALK